MFKNHDRERTRQLVFAEIEEVNTLHAHFHAYDLSGHTAGLADVLTGLLNRNAIGGAEQGKAEKDHEGDEQRRGALVISARCRALPGPTDPSAPLRASCVGPYMSC
jgi:hypothetical protein